MTRSLRFDGQGPHRRPPIARSRRDLPIWPSGCRVRRLRRARFLRVPVFSRGPRTQGRVRIRGPGNFVLVRALPRCVAVRRRPPIARSRRELPIWPSGCRVRVCLCVCVCVCDCAVPLFLAYSNTIRRPLEGWRVPLTNLLVFFFRTEKSGPPALRAKRNWKCPAAARQLPAAFIAA